MPNKEIQSFNLSNLNKVHCIFEEVKSKKKQELNLKPGTSKDFKELRESLDFDIE